MCHQRVLYNVTVVQYRKNYEAIEGSSVVRKKALLVFAEKTQKCGSKHVYVRMVVMKT